MVVEVGQAALRASWAEHGKSSEHLPPGKSAWLLLFYSVECGLKAVLMKDRRLRDTGQLDPHLRTHRLRELAKELRLARHIQDALQPCATRHGDGQVPFHDLHAAWRYGLALDATGQSDAVQGLNDLSEWCRSILGG